MELGDQRGIKTGRWLVNEILHADDINFLSQAQYQAVTEILSLLAEQGVATGATKDIVLAGLLLEHDNLLTCNLRTGAAVSFSGAYWNAEQWGFVASAGRIFSLLVPEDTAVAFDTGGTLDRIDLLEMRPARIAYDAVTRQFKDPVTGQVTSSVTNTKYEFGFEFQILKGTEGASPVAPTHTAGWIKVAEVEVDGSASSINQADIKDVRDSGGWTTEANGVKYKGPFIGEKVTSSPTGGTATSLDKEDTIANALNEVFIRLRNLSGVQDNAVVNRHIGPNAVRQTEVDLGVDVGDVDADVVPLGQTVASNPTGGTATSLPAASFIRAAIVEIFARLITLTGVSNNALLERHIGNDQVDSRHYVHDSMDEEHLNWGTGAGQIGLLKGHMAIALTQWDTVTQPQIAAAGSCEINGALYTNPAAVTITGATSNSTWYDILLTPSGSTYTASFVARMTGAWSDSKQGLYSGNNRVVACVYKDGSGDFISKNMLIVRSRIVEIVVDIGDWDMDATGTVTIAHGLDDKHRIRHVSCVVRGDSGSFYPHIYVLTSAEIESSDFMEGGIPKIDDTTVHLMRLEGGGVFNSTHFDATDFNRGWIYIGYKV